MSKTFRVTSNTTIPPLCFRRRCLIPLGFARDPTFDTTFTCSFARRVSFVPDTTRWTHSRCTFFRWNIAENLYAHQRNFGIHARREFSTNDGTPSLDPSEDSNSTIDDEWIPPNRPLVGDKGQAKLYSHIEEAEELHRLAKEIQLLEESEPSATDQEVMGEVLEPEELPPLSTVDWLKTRRTMLTAQKMMKPDDASLMKQALVDIDVPVVEHTLFTQQELVQLIQAVGGQNVQVVLDQVIQTNGRGRFGQGVVGIILVTGTNYVQMQQIADHIVRQLRRRRLEEVKVIGAESGPDGNLNDPNENWYVVDCGNYIVHIQDTVTREAVNLAALWSGKDPLRSVNVLDEEAVEDYVAMYPVPDGYTAGGARSPLYDAHSWDATIKQFERNRWSAPTTPARPKKPMVPKRKRKKSGRKT